MLVAYLLAQRIEEVSTNEMSPYNELQLLTLFTLA